MRLVRPLAGLAPVGGAALLFVCLCASGAPPVGAQEIAPSVPPEPAHTIGVELDCITMPFGFDDPYGWPLGGGVFYELRPIARVPGLHLGIGVSAFSVAPVAEGFGASFMVQPGVYAGYDLLCSPGSGFTWSAGLYGGYKHYIRRHILFGEPFLTYRPIAVAGLRLKLWIGRRLYVSSGAEYNLVVENTPVHTVAFTQRLGLRLGGRSADRRITDGETLTP